MYANFIPIEIALDMIKRPLEFLTRLLEGGNAHNNSDVVVKVAESAVNLF